MTSLSPWEPDVLPIEARSRSTDTHARPVGSINLNRPDHGNEYAERDRPNSLMALTESVASAWYRSHVDFPPQQFGHEESS
jgi:hypothetical protein